MFKETFKYYKSKWPTPNLDQVIDVDLQQQPVDDANAMVHAVDLNASLSSDELYLPLGLKPIHNWQCFSFVQHPGLLLIRNPFTTRGQRYWIARCLRDYPRYPNVVNLNSNLFTQAAIEDWWRELQNCRDKDEARRLKISMRWTTLGYHHDWNTKVYSEEMHTDFPLDLNQLCQYFASVLGYTNYVAQAAIVNYYPIGTTLAGHTDHSEQNLRAPLFSFSFGQKAIFLIGGPSNDRKPSALYLRSGDILVMTKESRLCYHAVPRIMKARHEPWNDLLLATLPIIQINSSSATEILGEDLNDNGISTLTQQPRKKQHRDYDSDNSDYNMALYKQVSDEHFWLPFKQYLNDSRINMNVRQVLRAGDNRLINQTNKRESNSFL